MACGRRVQGRHPLQTSDALLGPDAQALTVQLNKESGLPYGKIRSVFRTAFGISVSRGGAAQVVLRVAERLDPAYQQVFAIVRRSRVVYPDETAWKVAGRLRWLWTFVTRTATAYVIRASRGAEVVSEVLGDFYRGVMGHDGWAPYDGFILAGHQQCLAHLFRRCEELLSTARRGAVRFPRDLKALLKGTLGLRDRRDAGEVSAHGLDVAIGRLESRLNELLSRRFFNDDNLRLAKHVNNHADQIFTFLRRPGVEATNWPAEQAIRPAVVNRKVWGGNRTDDGARSQETLISVLRTLHQRRADALTFINHVLRTPPGRQVPALPAFASR